MVMPIKYTDEMVAEALAMRARGVKQIVIHATFGAGIEMAIRRVRNAGRRSTMANNLGLRTREAFEQLTRYGSAPFNEEMVCLLEALVELNDDLHHDRASALIQEDVDVLRGAMDKLYAALDVHV